MGWLQKLIETYDVCAGAAQFAANPLSPISHTPQQAHIEITIDERGEIVRKTVLQSLGPDIDSKCLAALENWHFHPATRNGTAIASKQDAVFPFHARG